MQTPFLSAQYAKLLDPREFMRIAENPKFSFTSAFMQPTSANARVPAAAAKAKATPAAQAHPLQFDIGQYNKFVTEMNRALGKLAVAC